MSFEEEEESFEHTLLVVREVAVYKIPPRTTSGGYKCGEWLQSDKIWSGRLRVVSCKDRCEIRLEDPSSGELFAACFVLPGQRDTSVEPVLDSSRYFVLKIEDGRGKHAFIGLGFNERNEAFDFNVALSDHDKYVKREHDKEAGESSDGSDDNHIDIHPAVNHRLKEGETIRITVKNKPSSGTGMLSAAGLSGGVSGTGKPKALSLAPPPTGATKIRSPLPPPPNDPAAVRITSTSHGVGLKGPKENATRIGRDLERPSFTCDSTLTLCDIQRSHGSLGRPWVMVSDFSIPEGRTSPSIGSCSKGRLAGYGSWGSAFCARYGGIFLRIFPQYLQPVCGLLTGSLTQR